MSPTEILGLILAGAAGGVINAVAGGGTLVTFPTLILFGTPSIVANATSTLALVIGTGGSIFSYRRYIPRVKKLLWRFIPISILGGWIGAELLTRTSQKAFEKLIPFLLLFATILFLSQGLVRKLIKVGPDSAHSESRHVIWGTILFQLGVSIYGGYFGAGIGILMLAALALLGLSDIYEMNTLKTILGSLINLVAAIWFIFSGLIHWPKAAVMTFGALGGYYLGAHFSQRISQKRVRQIITAVGFTISGVMFYRQFFR